MRTGHKPQGPRCAMGAFIPTTMDTESVKREGWNDHQILVVKASDQRLTWIEKQIIEQLGKRLYGKRG